MKEQKWIEESNTITPAQWKLLTAKSAKLTRGNGESDLQAACVQWFRIAFPKFKLLLFAIPNGGNRNFKTNDKGNRYSPDAQRLKAEGVLPGVSDLFLSVPCETFHGLYIEMKFGKNTMTPEQIAFKAAVEKYNYKHATCYSFNEFSREINLYLSNSTK